jgi:uncharacterized protein
MPRGKAADVPCVQLDDALRCRLFGHADRPAVCSSLRPDAEMCGASAQQALIWLSRLERATAPTPPARQTHG